MVVGKNLEWLSLGSLNWQHRIWYLRRASWDRSTEWELWEFLDAR